MKKIIQFERDDGCMFGRNENGTFSLLPILENHLNQEWPEEVLLSFRPGIQPIYEECRCHWCEDTSPRIKTILEALPTQELKDSFNILIEELGCSQLDLDVAEAKLAGEWPGWEWMTEARKTNVN